MLKSKPYYWVICDGCEANAQTDSDYSAWGDPGQAIDSAEDDGWSTDGAAHYCQGCTAKREAEKEDA